MISPSPVAPQAPISVSAYAPDPAIGPSPTLSQAPNERERKSVKVKVWSTKKNKING